MGTLVNLAIIRETLVLIYKIRMKLKFSAVTTVSSGQI